MKCELFHFHVVLLLLVLPRRRVSYNLPADATCVHSWRREAPALHLATHGHWAAVISEQM
jgi:hypothetical protein